MSNTDIDVDQKPTDYVTTLKQELLKFPQVDCQTTHLMHGGMYARTIFIPAGTVLTGVKTNIKNICIVAGDITVSTDDGLKRLTGYSIIPANAGFKRAGYAHADTYWTTLFKTELTDLEQIENFVTDEPNELQTRMLAIPTQTKNIEA